MKKLLTGQFSGSAQRGFPMNDTGISFTKGEDYTQTVTLQYWNSGVLTDDSGQPAGTVVIGVLDHNNITNEIGKAVGSKNNTSLSLSSTALTTEKSIDLSYVESYDTQSEEEKANKLTENLNNGEYVVDYVNGVIYGKKADSTTLVSASYKFRAGSSGLNSLIDETSNALRVENENPDYEHDLSSPHLIDVQNIADTNTHYAYVDWRTFKNGSLQFLFGGTDTITVKVAISNEVDESITTATYTDASTEILGASSITSDTVVFIDSNLAFAFMRIEYTSNNASSDGDLQVLLHKQY